MDSVKLITLGNIRLIGSSFTEKKPLLVLAYLGHEVSAGRSVRSKDLKEYFWQKGGGSLDTCLSDLRRKAGLELHIQTESGNVKLEGVTTDALELLKLAKANDFEAVKKRLTGNFLPSGQGISNEIDEWIRSVQDEIEEAVWKIFIKQALEEPEKANTLLYTPFSTFKELPFIDDLFLSIYSLLLYAGNAKTRRWREQLESHAKDLDVVEELPNSKAKAAAYLGLPVLTHEPRISPFRRKTKQERQNDARTFLIERTEVGWDSEFAPELEPKLRISAQGVLQSYHERWAVENVDLESGASLIDVFDKPLNFLLVLGQSGAGKSTALKELARILHNRAKEGVHPVPVIFDVSADLGMIGLTTWLAKKLSFTYGVSTIRGLRLLRTGVILPILDGLDQVEPRFLPKCVEAINKLPLENINLPGLIVSSRTHDYEHNVGRVKLRAACAVYLEPLEQDEVETYINCEDGFLGKRMQDTPELLSMLQTPLIARLFLETHRAWSPIERQKQTKKSPETLVDELWSIFTEEAFRKQHDRYSEDKIRHWLGCLASGMQVRGQTHVLVEHLQPDWLAPGLRNTYLFLSRLLTGLSAGSFFGVCLSLFWMMGAWLTGATSPIDLLQGLYFGGISGLVIGSGGLAVDTVRFNFERSPPWLSWMITLLTCGVATLVSWNILGIGPFTNTFVAIFACAVPMIVILEQNSDGKVAENLLWQRDILTYNLLDAFRGWSFRAGLKEVLKPGGLRYVFFALLGALLLGFALSLVIYVGWEITVFFLIAAVSLVLTLPAAAGLSSTYQGRQMDTGDLTNRGMKRFAYLLALNGLLIGPVFIGAAYVIVVLVLHTLGMLNIASAPEILRRQDVFAESMLPAVAASLATLILLVSHLADCIKHVVLRSLLFYSDISPRNYANLLEHAERVKLLKKEVNGFTFFHTTLRDFLSNRFNQK